MAACIAAGDHPQLIRVEGQVSEHPEGQAALVMQLIAPEFLNLAALPSLDSCSRDIYPADTRFCFEVALRMARGIASVAEHLHASGITHGDLYGHNILWRADGDCLLGDFGAASFYPNPELGLAMERIEVRAFGILLGELLERCEYGAEQAAVIEQLQDLRDRCMQAQVKNRPTFAALHRELIRR
jgi:serine/threonine protein kinase